MRNGFLLLIYSKQLYEVKKAHSEAQSLNQKQRAMARFETWDLRERHLQAGLLMTI